MISDEVRAAMPEVSSTAPVTARYKALKDKGLVLLSGEKTGQIGQESVCDDWV